MNLLGINTAQDAPQKSVRERSGSSFGFTVVGDIHLSSDTPRSRRDEFSQAALCKLRQILNFAANKKHKTLITTGDVFHSKQIHMIMMIMIMIIIIKKRRESALSLFSIIGNHDIWNNNIHTVIKAPLGLLFASRAVEWLGTLSVRGERESTLESQKFLEYPESSPSAHLPVLGSEDSWTAPQEPEDGQGGSEPWMVVQGHDIQPRVSLDASGLPEAALKVAVIHAFAGEDKAFFPEKTTDWISREQMACSGYDLIIAGHDHTTDYFELQNPKTGKPVKVLIPGSVMRGTTHSYRRDHKPQVFYVEASPDMGIRIESQYLDVQPSEEVFAVEQVERRDVNHQIQNFVDAIQVTYDSKGGIYEILGQIVQPGKIKDRVENYLQAEGIFP